MLRHGADGFTSTLKKVVLRIFIAAIIIIIIIIDTTTLKESWLPSEVSSTLFDSWMLPTNSLNSVNQLIFVMVKCGVLFEVRAEFLNII
jgi:hypothetical protein